MAVRTGTEIKVGIFVFVALVALGYMSLQVGKGEFGSGDTYDLAVVFDNVTGLKQGAPVEIAGIEVGSVRGIALDKGRALLTLAIRENVPVSADAVCSIKSRGVLGDKFVEIQPGTGAMARLQPGQRIARTDRSADMEVLFQKVGQIADDIGLVARSVANVMGGPQGEQDLRMTFNSLRDLTVGLNKMVQTNMEAVNEIVVNFREFSGDMSQITHNNKRSISKIVENFETASGQLRTTMAQVNQLMTKVNQGQGPLSKMVNDAEMGENLKKTVASLESVADKIDKGKGTLGRLVNDDTTSKELDKALEGINQYLDKQNQFKTSLDFHAEHLTSSGDTKSYLNFKLQPSEDRYYLLGVVDDPSGRKKDTDREVRYQTNDGSWNTYKESETKTVYDGIKFNAQIAKRWGDFALRGGLFESTGGAALDYFLWDDRVELFMEAFDFDRDDPPHLKAGAKLYFMKNFYVTAGADDFAGDGDDPSAFVGAGLFFTDDDLKYLFGSAPALPN